MEGSRWNYDQVGAQSGAASLAGSTGGDAGPLPNEHSSDLRQWPAVDEDPMLLAFTVTNLPEIRAAWGVGVAQRVCHAIKDRLADIVGIGAVVRVDQADRIKAAIYESSDLLPLSPASVFVRGFCDIVVQNPIEVNGVLLQVALEGDWYAEALEAGQSPSRVMTSADWLEGVGPGDIGKGDQAGEPVLIGGPVWAERCHADMALAVELFRRLSQDEITLAWQPVRKLTAEGESAGILYLEALLRGIADEEDSFFCSAVAALERVGLAPTFDRFIVERVLDRLREDENLVLGVNISAQSVRLGGWWNDLLASFRASPGLASRLVIEITETATFPSISAAVEFVDVLRRQGCLIALDDFGVGHASVRHLLALAPDIVKIDALFLRRADQPGGSALLHHLIGLAKAVTPMVVVEGVETQTESQLIDSVSCGDCWQQGYFLGRPSRILVWEGAREDSRVKALRQFRGAFRAHGARTA